MNEALALFFSSGRAVDAVIAITIVEGFALAAYHRMTGNGVAPQEYLLNMIAGLCLMLALRFALVGSTWIAVAVCLTASGVLHMLDLTRRWRRKGRQPNFR